MQDFCSRLLRPVVRIVDDVIDSPLRTKRPCRLGVRGTPGIGKTMLGLYMLWRLMNDSKHKGRTLQYVVLQENKPVVYTISPDGSIHEGGDIQLGCLAVRDSVPWAQNHAHGSVFFVTSPNEDVYRKFSSKGDSTYVHTYLPTWTWLELQAAKHCVPTPISEVRLS